MRDRLLLFAIALTALYGGYYWGNQQRPSTSGDEQLRRVTQPIAVRAFLLTDDRGEPFTERELKGHWNLLFFGYARGEETKVMLTLASRIYNRLAASPDLQSAFRAVLISVDPVHDTAEELHRLVGSYNDGFIALTGSNDETEILAEQFGARYRASGDRLSQDYRIEHSSSMALVDPNGDLLGLFTGIVDPVGIAANIRTLSENR